MASRSLSPLEARLILHLEWEKQPVVTVEEAMAILDCSYDHARQVLHRLAQRRWLTPITPGKYELIPAERGEHAFPDINPLFTGSVLVIPYYSSSATAAFFWGPSAQAATTVYVTITRHEARRAFDVRGKTYRLAYRFLGAVEIDAYGSRGFPPPPALISRVKMHQVC